MDAVLLEADRPDHVPESLVVDFDMYHCDAGVVDAQSVYFAIKQRAPDVFWTPRNGGHWVATRGADIEAILRDPVRFSSERIMLPRDDSIPSSPPIETDPPRHTALRKPLNRGLFPKAVDATEDGVRELTVSLIEGLKAKGSCEFVSEFAQVLPLSIFLDLVDLPRSERPKLLPIVEQFIKGGTAAIRVDAQRQIYGYVQSTVQARRATPGDDLASAIVNCEVDGERIGEDEAVGYVTLLMFAGMDTVAAVLSYIASFLASHPDHRRQLASRIDDESFVKRAIEEFLRRYGVVNTARVVTEESTFGPARLLPGDMLLPVNALCGLDEAMVDNPLEIDFGRPGPIRHTAFGAGPHTCPGATLARREFKIFLEEWLTRVPEFGIKPGTAPQATMGLASGLQSLHLVW